MKWLTHNHYIQLAAGIILLISVLTDLLHIHVGLIGIGISHVLGAIPNIVQAAERVEKGVDKE